jgi:hypothetical protein
MGFIDFASKVFVVRQELLEINSGILIKKHTSNSWSKLFSKGLLNKSVDAVSNELRDLLTCQGFKWGDVDLRQLDKLLIHLNLLWCSWLLLLHVHLLWINLSLVLHWWLRHSSHIHLTTLLIHSLSSLLIRIMLLIHVLIIVVITSTLLIITTSALAISSTSSSLLVWLISVIVVPVLLCATLVLVWNSHLIHCMVNSVTLSKQLKGNEYDILQFEII